MIWVIKIFIADKILKISSFMPDWKSLNKVTKKENTVIYNNYLNVINYFEVISLITVIGWTRLLTNVTYKNRGQHILVMLVSGRYYWNVSLKVVGAGALTPVVLIETG